VVSLSTTIKKQETVLPPAGVVVTVSSLLTDQDDRLHNNFKQQGAKIVFFG